MFNLDQIIETTITFRGKTTVNLYCRWFQQFENTVKNRGLEKKMCWIKLVIYQNTGIVIGTIDPWLCSLLDHFLDFGKNSNLSWFSVYVKGVFQKERLSQLSGYSNLDHLLMDFKLAQWLQVNQK